MSSNSGCNSYNTTYTINGQAITIQMPLSTGALCGDPADSIEQLYLSLLPQAASFEISGNQLILRNSGGQEILRYARIG